MQKVINYYSKRKNTISYACIDHLKSVSKLSVSKKIINEYDYLPNLICNEKIMKEIDNKIMSEYIVNIKTEIK